MEQSIFSEFSLSPEVLRAIESVGYTEPTEIQMRCIEPLLAGHDLIGQSQTGAGKTAAFGLPAVERASLRRRCVQTLILCPTRELAMQAAEEIRKFGRFRRGLRCAAVYGGASMDSQIRALRQAHIVVGTPGRIMDHMRRKTLDLSQLETIVLDEADEMLNMGFIDDIETILKALPEQRQTALFSATMPPEILRIAKRYLNDPVHVKIAKKQLTVEGIEQVYYEIPAARKLDALCALIDLHATVRAIIFCNTKRQVDDLVGLLMMRGYRADGLHGDMKQTQRSRVMSLFKNGRTRLLVATDVAARGIDVDDIETVFNFDLPQDQEFYVHRVGRTGRAGKSGLAITLICDRRELSDLRNIERYTKSRIRRRALPSAEVIEEARQSAWISGMKEALSGEISERYAPVLTELMDETGCTARDVALALLARALDRPRSAEDEARDRMTKLCIRAGRARNLCPGDIVGALTAQTDVTGDDIGAIAIHDDHSTVEIAKEHCAHVLEVMNQKTGRIKGFHVPFELAAQ